MKGHVLAGLHHMRAGIPTDRARSNDGYLAVSPCFPPGISGSEGRSTWRRQVKIDSAFRRAPVFENRPARIAKRLRRFIDGDRLPCSKSKSSATRLQQFLVLGGPGVSERLTDETRTTKPNFTAAYCIDRALRSRRCSARLP